MDQFSLHVLTCNFRKIDKSNKTKRFFSVSVIIWPLQVDTNKDRLVSLDEFLVATKKKEFLEPDSWEVSVTRYWYIIRPLINNI